MISLSELENISWQRFADMQCLMKGQRFDGAIYIGGYCLEIAFKARLCKENNRSDFPENWLEFKKHNLQAWQKHSLIELAKLCHLYGFLKKHHRREWSSVQDVWSVEMRYKSANLKKEDANDFINDTKALLKVIL